MSEKEFEVLFWVDMLNNCVRDKNGKKYNLHQIIDLLNEQQASIDKLQANIQYLLDSKKDLLEKIGEQESIIDGLKEKLCELGVSDVKINGKRINTGLEEWLE